MRHLVLSVTVPSDYFELMGIPPRLAISRDELQARFYELSRQWHPDRFARKPAREQQLALDMSSALNDAYRTLREPVTRAEHVLKQNGFDIGEQRSNNVPPELLEEVFELNMALEEVRSGDDSVRPQLEQAGHNFQSMLSAIDQELTGLFEKFDNSQNREVLAQIRGTLNRRKYIQNLVNEVAGALAK